MLEQRLQWQQKQSMEDAKWLHKEEENMQVSYSHSAPSEKSVQALV